MTSEETETVLITSIYIPEVYTSHIESFVKDNISSDEQEQYLYEINKLKELNDVHYII